MIGRVLTAYRIELVKAMRWKFTYVGPLLLILLVLAAPLHPVIGEDPNVYRFIAFATPAALNLVGIFLLLGFCAGLISSETGTGTIRLLLTRPLLRHEFMLSKLLMGFTYATSLTVLVALAAWSVAMLLGTLSGIEYGGEMLYTSGQMARAYVLGLLLALLPQWAFVCYAVMISTLVRNTGAAVITAIGIWLVVDIVKYPLRMSQYLFSSYVEVPWDVFSDRCQGLDAQWDPSVIYWVLGTSLSAGLLFAAVSLIAIRRRNLYA